MIRPPLLILAGAAVLAAAVTFWPGEERDTVAAGLLPANSGPRLAEAGSGPEEPSSAARMTRFAAAGAPVATAGEGEAPAAPPPVDLIPVLVGVMGKDGALTGYFSSSGSSIRARQGDNFDGWRVVSLGRRDARLVKGRQVVKLSLFSARGGPLSPAMAPAEPRAVAAPPALAPNDNGEGVAPPAAPTAPKPQPRVRRQLPPLPPGSKGWWSGPPGAKPPPGYTPLPRLND